MDNALGYCVSLTTMKNLYRQWAGTQESVPQGLIRSLETILVWAVWLHEVGLSISLSGLPSFGLYSAEHNLQDSREQQLLLAALVRYHPQRR